MYESMTYEVIMQKMLERVPDTFDKREGSIIFDALAPAAAELAQLYIELDVVLNQTFADTATFEYLEKRCAERGIRRMPATCAVVRGKFTPASVDVIGQRFSCGIYNYKVTEATDEAGAYELICETSGEAPNAVSGQLIPIHYISGMQTAEITGILIPGEEKEDDEALRKRYFDSIQSQAFGGNIADYKAKTKAIDGVGGVKVTPVWNGGGTVKLTVISSDYSAPKKTLIDKVQETIDPAESQGKGKGLAPIGHVVSVDGVTESEIDITTTITYESGWNLAESGRYIEDRIDEYFLSLAKAWEDSGGLIVRISAVEQKILSCPGVIDVENTLLNGASRNLQLGLYEIPARGEFSDGS